MTQDELESRYTQICPKCLNHSWTGEGRCVDNKCNYDKFEEPRENIIPSGHVLADRYFIGHTLGEGGQAIAYRALDTHTNTKVVVKELFPVEFASRNENYEVIAKIMEGNSSEILNISKEAFLQEIQCVSEIHHESIVKYVGYFLSNNTIYLITDYEEGNTLTEYVNICGELGDHGEYKRISFDQAIRLLRPIMRALIYFHDSSNLIHRDISPDNIFIRDANPPILLDFGSACEPGKGSLLHKPGFTAPEIEEGRQAEQSAHSDVYGLAATLYWCCTGDFAWHSDGEIAAQFQSLREKGVQCSEAEDRAVTKALSREPKRRHRNIAEFERDLLSIKPPPSSTKPLHVSEIDVKISKPSQSPAEVHEPHEEPKQHEWSRESLRRIVAIETSIIVFAVLVAFLIYNSG